MLAGVLALALVAALTGWDVVEDRSAHAADCVVAAGGDVAAAEDYRTGAEASARIIEAAGPTAVLALGDLAYETGTDAEFAAYYAPTWGRFKQITRPVPGNHEYQSGAGGYFRYFGVPSFYAFDICGWRAVALNSEVSHGPQIAFLAAERAAHPERPLLVYWHRPRFSSGQHGDDAGVHALWQAAVSAGAKIVLTAHEHSYERFAPMDSAGQGDPTGPRQFVSGTGGHRLRPFGTVKPNSEARIAGRPGALLLTLSPTSYAWRYVDTAGTQDTGTVSFASTSPQTPFPLPPGPTGRPTPSSPAPPQAPSVVAPTLVLGRSAIPYGASEDVRVRGSAGSPVDLYAASLPGTVHKVIRSTTLDGAGVATWSLQPGATTSLYAVVDGERTGRATLGVARAVTLGVRQTSRGHRFSGRVDRPLAGL